MDSCRSLKKRKVDHETMPKEKSGNSSKRYTTIRQKVNVNSFTFERITMTPIDIICEADAPNAVHSLDWNPQSMTHVHLVLFQGANAHTEQSILL